MCIICGDLDLADINHLEGVAQNLSNEDLQFISGCVKKQLKNSQILNVPEDVVKSLRRTALVLAVEQNKRR